ncbi:hypothetical protein [Rhodococcus wratislaviensis]|uniref:hypothetical protein n=1 Tax=Rhodococcus wratislaviensis TaxID=44752 RepID=UPI001788D67A|nr:hypothetical protein [Rhodococcus wratislaviensis]
MPLQQNRRPGAREAQVQERRHLLHGWRVSSLLQHDIQRLAVRRLPRPTVGDELNVRALVVHADEVKETWVKEIGVVV